MPSNQEAVTRQILKIGGGLSVGYVVTQLISNNVNTSTLPRKAAVIVGTYLIGEAVAKKTEPIIDEKIDLIVGAYKTLRNK